MRQGAAYGAFWLGVTLSLTPSVGARTPLDCFEVVTVTPSNVIKHDVTLKDSLGDGAIETYLTGPQLFAHPVGLAGDAVQDPNAYFNWYRITRPSVKSQRVLTVRDALRGGEPYHLTLGSPAYLLSPAQKLTSGSPAPVSERLSHFKAYAVLDGRPANQNVSFTDAYRPARGTANKPIFLCVPAEEWHHAKHFPIKEPEDCLVVYGLSSQNLSADLATIDQFGLNQLKVLASEWICVPAEILGDGTTRSGK